MPLKPITRTDCSGGLNVVASPWAMQANELLRAENLLLDETGSVRGRAGAQTVDMAPSTTDSILAIHSLVRTDGSVYALRLTREQDGSQHLYQSAAPWADLGTVALQYATPK